MGLGWGWACRDAQRPLRLSWLLYGVGMGLGLERYSGNIEAELAAILLGLGLEGYSGTIEAKLAATWAWDGVGPGGLRDHRG